MGVVGLEQRTLAALQSQQQGLRTPVPLCYQPGLHLLWQEALPGVPLADHARVIEIARRAGRLRVKVHIPAQAAPRQANAMDRKG